MVTAGTFRTQMGVTSYAEVWIEILENKLHEILNAVTSYAEVWIEIDG